MLSYALCFFLSFKSRKSEFRRQITNFRLISEFFEVKSGLCCKINSKGIWISSRLWPKISLSVSNRRQRTRRFSPDLAKFNNMTKTKAYCSMRHMHHKIQFSSFILMYNMRLENWYIACFKGFEIQILGTIECFWIESI